MVYCNKLGLADPVTPGCGRILGERECTRPDPLLCRRIRRARQPSTKNLERQSLICILLIVLTTMQTYHQGFTNRWKF